LPDYEILTPDLLDRLEDLWRRQQAPLVEGLQAGLPESVIDELTAELGIRLPSEARTWWQWHNGAAAHGPLAAHRELGPGFAFLSLDEAVALYRRMRAMFEDIWRAEGPETIDYWWRPSWFPITERRGPVRCDCAVPDDAPTPIYWAYSHDHDADGLTQPKVESFGTLVSWWIDALERRAWHFNHETDRWQHHPELLAADRERSGLV
jgi:cell wall assembly regulator SMI1